MAPSPEISRQNIIEDLDMALMLAGQLVNERWTFSGDVIYFDISDTGRAPLDEGETLRRIELEAWIVTPTVGYRLLDSPAHQFEVFAGARYLWLDVGTRIDLSDPNPPGSVSDSDGDSVWDAIVGFRGRYRIGERWFLPYALDVGTGDSDSVIQTNVALAYVFDSLELVGGWRYENWEFDDDAGTLDSLNVNGPYAGVVWRF